jgi:hypothetical protein
MKINCQPSSKCLSLCVSAVVLLSAAWNAASADALDQWTRAPLATINDSEGVWINHAVFGNGKYVAVGQRVMSDFGFVATSTDGSNWEAPGEYGSVLQLNSVAYGGGRFVAVGWNWHTGGNLWSSSDGLSWTYQTNATVRNFMEVTYGNERFVAVGDGMIPGTFTHTNRTIYASLDGIAWSQRSSGAPPTDNSALESVAYGAGQFVAVGENGNVYTSTSGGTWTPAGAGVFGPVSFCRDRFIARGQSGANLVSTDGLNWSPMTKNVTNDFIRVRYGYGRFLALSADKVFSSPDSTNWVQHPVPFSANTTLIDIAFGERNVIVLANENPLRPVVPVAFISSSFMALGINRQAKPQLVLSGLEGASYRIEYADALPTPTTQWQEATTLVLTNSPLVWSDTTATGPRFYRAVMLP